MIESSRSKSSASSRYVTTTRRAMGSSYGDLEEADEGSKRGMREIYGSSRTFHRRPKGWIVFLVAVPFILIFGIHAAMSWYVHVPFSTRAWPCLLSSSMQKCQTSSLGTHMNMHAVNHSYTYRHSFMKTNMCT